MLPHEPPEKLIDEKLLEREKAIREENIHNPILLAVVNIVSAFVAFMLHVVSLEMILSLVLTVSLTVYLFNKLVASPDALDASVMDFVLLSFAVVTPLSNSINMAYRRREEALYNMAAFRATSIEIFLAHAVWDWNQKPGVLNESGRISSIVDWAKHADEVANELLAICHEVTRYLTLPCSSRARHKTLRYFKSEAKRTRAVAEELHRSVVIRMSRISDLCEILKREGLPGNEAARIRHWERSLAENIEKMRMIKVYRTPQGLRSFGRLFSVFLPAFYCPFYADMSYKLDSLPFGIVFALITSIALTGLFETVSQFEDPFSCTSNALDGIHVHQELVGTLTPELFTLYQKYFPEGSVTVHTNMGTDEEPSASNMEVRILGE
jgi:hypothetical protein